jgi:rhamnosyltransferase
LSPEAEIELEDAGLTVFRESFFREDLMVESDMDVSVVILTKNAGDGFGELLRCLFSQNVHGDYEVIVIDSGSTDRTIAVARNFPVKMARIRAEEFHHGKTRNLGAELSSGKIVAYITQDALPLHDDWLEKLTEDLRDPGVAMVVGRQIPWHDTKPPEKFFYDYYFPEHRIEVFRGVSRSYRDSMFISNVSSAIKRNVWQDLKFSENMIRGEDKEFANRVLLAGWKIVYRPDAAVYHAHDFGLWSLFRTSADIGVALSQGAGLSMSGNWMAGRLGYYGQEARYIASGERWWKWLPYSMLYEASKLSGMAAGWVKSKSLSLLKRSKG